MYDDLIHVRTDNTDPRVDAARQIIYEEISTDNHMKTWYTENWFKSGYDFCDILYDSNGELVSLNGNTFCEDSIKILGRFHVRKNMRTKYKSVHQVILIPNTVIYAKSLGYKAVWYNFHRFDKRHERYSDSQKRLLNGSKIPEKFMPHWKDFKFMGEYLWNNVIQDKFEYRWE